jgi:SSS family solute:Na+ symporter
LATTPPDYVTIKGLSFGTLSAEDKAATKGSYSKVDVVLSVLLVIIVIAILSYFTG